jgi:hypothetical protein
MFNVLPGGGEEVERDETEQVQWEKSDWGPLVPRINIKNIIKLGSILE